MARTDVFDSVCERAASFGRDVFHYLVTGTIFSFLLSVPWWSKLDEVPVRIVVPIFEDAGVQIALLFVALMVLFSLGHVLLSVGFCVQKLWISVFSCCRHVRKYYAAISRVRRVTGRKTGRRHLAVNDASNAHLGLEMSVLLKQPKLHANFIERYNTVWHLRLGLAASLLAAGVTTLVICSFLHDGEAIAAAVVVSWIGLGFASEGQPDRHRYRLLGVAALSAGIVALAACGFLGSNRTPVVVGLVAIALGLMLVRQHLVTKTNFLERVVVAFSISERTPS